MKYTHRKLCCLMAACCIALTACGYAERQIDVATTPTESIASPAIPETIPETDAPTEPPTEPEIEFNYTICFTGDICVEDGARTTARWIANGRDTSACFDETIMAHMQGADICFANNEFP